MASFAFEITIITGLNRFQTECIHFLEYISIINDISKSITHLHKSQMKTYQYYITSDTTPVNLYYFWTHTAMPLTFREIKFQTSNISGKRAQNLWVLPAKTRIEYLSVSRIFSDMSQNDIKYFTTVQTRYQVRQTEWYLGKWSHRFDNFEMTAACLWIQDHNHECYLFPEIQWKTFNVILHNRSWYKGGGGVYV